MASQALYLAPGLALDGLPRATGPGLVGFVSGAAQVAAYARAAPRVESGQVGAACGRRGARHGE